MNSDNNANKSLPKQSPLQFARSVVRFSGPVLTKSIHPRVEWIKQTMRYRSAAPSASKLIVINPEHVEYLAVPRQYKFNRVSKYGTYILDGEWDQKYSDKKLFFLGTWEGFKNKRDFALIKFSNYVFYTSAREHFHRGVDWKDTEIYDYFIESSQKSNTGGRYRTEQQIIDRLEEFDNLYMQIRENGYLTQEELEGQSDVPLDESNRRLLEPWQNEVMVSIGRHGEIFFNEGRHRFIIAKLLGLDSIPVRVLVRHKQWQKSRYKVTKNKQDRLTKTVKQWLSHPDMQDVIKP